MELLGIPFWVFAVMMAGSVGLGLILRFWMDRRKERQAIEEKERIKEMRKENKRNLKKAKKAAKSRKNTPARPESEE
jgi:hypothetical protein